MDRENAHGCVLFIPLQMCWFILRHTPFTVCGDVNLRAPTVLSKHLYIFPGESISDNGSDHPMKGALAIHHYGQGQLVALDCLSWPFIFLYLPL